MLGAVSDLYRKRGRPRKAVGSGDSGGSRTGQYRQAVVIVMRLESVCLFARGQEEYTREYNLYIRYKLAHIGAPMNYRRNC